MIRTKQLVGVIAAIGLLAGCTSAKTVSNTTTTARTNHPPTARTSPPATAAQSGPKTTFGNGSYAVGTAASDIAPGTYRTAGGSPCGWQRESDLSGSANSIIGKSIENGPEIVTILPTDAGFETGGSCATWSPLPSSGPQATSFGDGAYAVGIDIAPGTYSTQGGSGTCYWQRNRDFLWNSASIIADGSESGPLTLTIEPTDKAVDTQGCGTWNLQ